MTLPRVRPALLARLLVALGILAVILLVSIQSASTASVTPTAFSGNPTCATLAPGTSQQKVEPVADGTFIKGPLTVTIDVRSTAEGQVFDFTANIGLDAVKAKGGPGGNLYTYNPETTADTGLHAPVNPNSGKYYDLSHISFCYDTDPSTATATKTATATRTPRATRTATATKTATNTAVPTATNTVVATCPGGADGAPECNPQIDAEVNLSVDCSSPNQDGTYNVTGVFSITNQSEHAQDIRITEVVGPTVDSEAFFLGQVILNGQTLSYTFQSTYFPGPDPDAKQFISASVLFESVQGRGTVREPRGDVEEFFLNGDDCTAVAS